VVGVSRKRPERTWRVAGRENMTAASAAYLNEGMEPTASSVRSSVAPASGSGSCLAFGIQSHRGEQQFYLR